MFTSCSTQTVRRLGDGRQTVLIKFSESVNMSNCVGKCLDIKVLKLKEGKLHKELQLQSVEHDIILKVILMSQWISCTKTLHSRPL